VFDTRPGTGNVGPRTTPLGPGDTLVATVRGTNGNCTIPTDAVGLTMNVAIINPSTASFLTVFPADAPRPLAANANWVANQPPLSNAVTADISADGKIAFYNLAGTVDVAADIVGYYVDHPRRPLLHPRPRCTNQTDASPTSAPPTSPDAGNVSASSMRSAPTASRHRIPPRRQRDLRGASAPRRLHRRRRLPSTRSVLWLFPRCHRRRRQQWSPTSTPPTST
jgi:hypothetical protein